MLNGENRDFCLGFFTYSGCLPLPLNEKRSARSVSCYLSFLYWSYLFFLLVYLTKRHPITHSIPWERLECGTVRLENSEVVCRRAIYNVFPATLAWESMWRPIHNPINIPKASPEEMPIVLSIKEPPATPKHIPKAIPSLV